MGQDCEDGQGHRVADAGYTDEIRAAVRYERALLWKACIALAAVVVIVVVHQLVT